jgi:histone-lysine N-methyltransferase SETMAR
LVLSDRQIKLIFIARVIGILETTVWKVLHDDLGMKKMSACWIPRLLTREPKIVRKEISQKDLIALQADDSFFLQIVAGGESLVYHWNPLTKQESTHWLIKVRLLPTESWDGTIMATIFLGRGRNSAY